MAITACLAAAPLYDFAANDTQRRLTGVPALPVATGSQTRRRSPWPCPPHGCGPGAGPSATASTVVGLALLCTALACLLYFHLIATWAPRARSRSSP